MFRLKNGCLTMENYDLEHIEGLINEEGYSPKEALIIELDNVGIDIKEVYSIELNGTQMSNKDYVEIYSKIVCDIWNSK